MIPTDSTQRLAPDPRPQPRPDTTTPIESQRMPPPQSRAASGRREKVAVRVFDCSLPLRPARVHGVGEAVEFVRPRFVGVRHAHCQPASGPEKLVILTRLYPFAYCKLGKMKTRTITRCSVLYEPFVGFDIGTPRSLNSVYSSHNTHAHSAWAVAIAKSRQTATSGSDQAWRRMGDPLRVPE